MSTSHIHTLTERAMVMSLNISRWQGQRLDREASRQVTVDNGAAADAARVNKHLIPKEDLAPVVTAANTVRDHFYTNTLPWRDGGYRLMTRKLYLTFIREHEKLAREFDEAVATFLDDKYPKAIQRAEFRMGLLFKADDYPPVAELRRRFGISLDIDAVTTANDFRVQLDQAHVDRVRASIEKAAEERIHAAMGDVWRRMAETVGYFAERMGTPDAVFRDATVEKLSELVDLIPGLNVLDDPNIEAIRQQIAALPTATAQEIRKDPALRSELAGEAKAIVDKMAGFMAALGGGES